VNINAEYLKKLKINLLISYSINDVINPAKDIFFMIVNKKTGNGFLKPLPVK